MPESPTAKFVRIWRGRTKRDVADEYQLYWLAHGIAPLIQKGALSVEMLREDRENDAEFLTISHWDSLERMAPDWSDPHRTHHLPRDPEFLLEVPDRVQILKILTPI